MKADLYWIPGPWKGHLAILGRPRGGDWLEDEVAGWRLAGLDTVVSLLERSESVELGLDHEAQTGESQNIRVLSHPTPDRGIPISTQETARFLYDLLHELDSGKCVGLHCRQSVGRSGLIAIALLILAGFSLKDARDLVRSARGLEVPETAEQLDWLEELATRHAAAADAPQYI